MRPQSPPEMGRPTPMGLLRQMWYFIFEHELMTRASAIAFASLTAAVPLLAVTLLVLVQLLPDIGSSVTDTHQGLGALMLQQLQLTLQSMFPPEAYKVVEEQIARIQTSPPFGVMGITLVLTLWTASGVFRAAIDAMNHVYGVVEQRPVWRVWLLSIWMTIIQTAILIGALLFVIAWPVLVHKMGMDGVWLMTDGVRSLTVFGIVMISFALLFHMGPDVLQAHRWVTPGSIVGTLLFFASCWGLKMYVQNFANYDRTYGSLGGVMILLLWFYVNALVMLLAAEINRICHVWQKQCKLHRQQLRQQQPPTNNTDGSGNADKPQ